MRHSLFFALQLFLLLFYQSFVAQPFGLQYRDQFYYATALSYPSDGNYRVLALGAVPGQYSYSKIFVYNGDLNLIDSIPLLKGCRPERNEPLKVNDRLYWAVTFNDTLNSSGGAVSVLVLDTFYRFKALHKLNGYYPGSLSSVNLAKIGNRFYTSYFKDNNTAVIYKLDTQFTKLDSVKYTINPADVRPFGDKLMVSSTGTTVYPCTGKYNGSLKMTLLDTSLIQNSCFTFDSVGFFTAPNYPPVQRVRLLANPGSTKTIPISNTKFLTLGSSGINYSMGSGKLAIVNTILNNTNQIVKTNVFGNATANTNYFENSNFVSVKKNEIVSVGCIGNDFQYPAIAQPQKTKLFVNKIDTLGNVIWVKEHGGDMFYRPGSIVFTSDGGCLIAGWRYDTTTMKSQGFNGQSVFESFLLKLDANGNYNAVGLIQNGKMQATSGRCYPNPTNQSLTFDLPFQKKCELSISDSYGREVLRIKDYENFTPVDISGLPTGIYLYTLHSENKQHCGKFCKSPEY